MAIYRELIETPDDQSFRLLHWQDSLANVRMCVGSDASVPITGRGERWHAHRSMELTFIASGGGSRFVGDHIGAIGPPELVLLGPDLPHYWSGLNESHGASVQIHPSQLGELSEAVALQPLWELGQRGLLFDPETAAAAGAELQHMVGQPPLRRLATLLAVFDHLLAASNQAQLLCSKPYAVNSRARHQDQVSHAIEILLSDFDQPLTVQQISAAVELPAVTLSRYFRRYTGRSLIEFLNEVRIDHARRLLIESDQAIGQVALAAGFGNLSHFNRQFRRKAGCSPREFRMSGGGAKEMLAAIPNLP